MFAAIPLLQHEAQYQNCFYIPGFPVPHLVVIFFIIVISVPFWHHRDFDCVMTTHNLWDDHQTSIIVYMILHEKCLSANLYGFYSCKMDCLSRIELMIEPCKTKNNRFIHVLVTAVQLWSSIIFTTHPGFANKKNYYEQLQQFAVCCSVHVALYLID